MVAYLKKTPYIDELTIIMCSNGEEVGKLVPCLKAESFSVNSCHEKTDQGQIGK